MPALFIVCLHAAHVSARDASCSEGLSFATAPEMQQRRSPRDPGNTPRFSSASRPAPQLEVDDGAEAEAESTAKPAPMMMQLEFDLAHLDYSRLSSNREVTEAMTRALQGVVARHVDVHMEQVAVELNPGPRFCVKVATPRAHEAAEMRAQIDGDVDGFFRSVEERMRAIPGVQDVAIGPGLGCGSLKASVVDDVTARASCGSSTLVSKSSADGCGHSHAPDTLTVRMVPASAASRDSTLRVGIPTLPMHRAQPPGTSEKRSSILSSVSMILVIEFAVAYFANWKLQQHDIQATLKVLSGFMAQFVGVTTPRQIVVEVNHTHGGLCFKVPVNSAAEAQELKKRIDEGADDFLRSVEEVLQQFLFVQRGVPGPSGLGCGSVKTAMKVGALKSKTPRT